MRLQLFEQRARDADVEQLDQRAHEEGGDDRADAGNGRNLRNLAAGNEEEQHAGDNAHEICSDAAVLETCQFPLAGVHKFI